MIPRHPFAVLFLYHRADAVTIKHLELMRQGAKGAPVVPLTDGGEHIDGSIDVQGIPTRCCVTNKWASVDTVVYRWFASRDLEAERYIIVEWDCLLIGTIEDFYRPVWDLSFCGRSIHRLSRGDRWHWFKKSKHLFAPEENYGVAPLAGMFLAHSALMGILEVIERDDRFVNLFCENRLATAAAQAGIPLTNFPEAVGKLTVKRLRTLPSQSGVYHKVKDDLVGQTPPSPTEVSYR